MHLLAKVEWPTFPHWARFCSIQCADSTHHFHHSALLYGQAYAAEDCPPYLYCTDPARSHLCSPHYCQEGTSTWEGTRTHTDHDDLEASNGHASTTTPQIAPSVVPASAPQSPFQRGMLIESPDTLAGTNNHAAITAQSLSSTKQTIATTKKNSSNDRVAHRVHAAGWHRCMHRRSRGCHSRSQPPTAAFNLSNHPRWAVKLRRSTGQTMKEGRPCCKRE